MGKELKKAFLVLALCVCSFLCLIFDVNTVSVKAESVNQVIATTNANVTQGRTGTCYVYIDSLEGMSAIDVAVYFDSEKISVTSVYNSVTADVYDNVKTEESVKFSYIFDGKGFTSKTRLFYFNYKILDTATIGETYFDVVVGEAYDFELNDIAVSGSRCAFSVIKKIVSKSCTVSSSSSISTSINGEFSLSYRLSSYQIASGSVCITYDNELFEVLDTVDGGFLSNKVVDVNTDHIGAIYVSFVGTEYVNKYDLITLTFKTLKNVTESSEIKFSVTEFYDKDLNLISCKGYTTTANIVFDDTYTADSPSVVVLSEYSENKVTATIKLAPNSHLGAGDFILSFDTNVLTFASYEKGFSPSFFNVNDKEVLDGKLKFSIISLEDIVTEEIVITIVFDTVQSCTDKQTEISLEGSGFADSLTNPISLHLVNSNITVPLRHVECVLNAVLPTCTESGLTEGVGCSVCKAVLVEQEIISALGHDEELHEAKSPTCIEKGWKEYVTCKNCDYSTYEELSATGHDYNSAVTAPTCTDKGYTTYTCHCGDSYIDNYVNALGHTEGKVVVENNLLPDCTNEGCYDNVIYCTVCKEELSRETIVVDALGHTEVIDTAVAPTCTTTGLTEGKHCSVCNTVLVAQQVVNSLGHDYGGWTSNDNNTHVKTCNNNSSHKIIEECSGGMATCTEKAVCEICGEKYGELLEHEYSSDWKHDENYHYHECSCGDKSNISEHAWDEGIISREQTIEHEGERIYTCVDCGRTKTEQIPKKEKPATSGCASVTTGGSGGGAFGDGFTVALVSMGGTAILLMVRRKKQKYNKN